MSFSIFPVGGQMSGGGGICLGANIGGANVAGISGYHHYHVDQLPISQSDSGSGSLISRVIRILLLMDMRIPPEVFSKCAYLRNF